MGVRGVFGVLAAAALLLTACDGDDTTSPTTTSTTTTTGAVEETTTTSDARGLSQPAVWPADDVVFDTPEAAAEDFVSTALGVPPTIGEFRQGDARSGEIEVYSSGDGGERGVARSVLLLRQVGPDDGWFVIGAASDNATIDAPETMEEVPAGRLAVEGVARGFEANVVVTAFIAGDADARLDQEVTMGGAFETPEPYSVTLDLSGASPGDVVTLLVRGGSGLETDPGDFAAIPVVITG